MTTRWYLKRGPQLQETFLVVEQVTTGLGFRMPVTDRQHARQWLPQMQCWAASASTENRTKRFYGPVEIDG